VQFTALTDLNGSGGDTAAETGPNQLEATLLGLVVLQDQSAPSVCYSDLWWEGSRTAVEQQPDRANWCSHNIPFVGSPKGLADEPLFPDYPTMQEATSDTENIN
jgi:hypothetical protein